MRTKLLVVAGVASLAATLVGCGNDGSDARGTIDEPRTIEVAALDPYAYEPTSITVEAGETVRFVVTNTGGSLHEFIVGDMEMQAMAEEQMSQGMNGHAEAKASLEIAPGQTAKTTVTFDGTGELLYACHVSGHYEGGMVGTITIS